MGQRPVEVQAGRMGMGRRIWLSWGSRQQRVCLGWGRGRQRVCLGGVRGECSICPSPVSCSDTSFITGRKEAISMGAGGLQLHKGLAQVPPPPPHSGSQKDDGKSRWRVLSALQARDTPCMATGVYTSCMYVHMYAHIMYT